MLKNNICRSSISKVLFKCAQRLKTAQELKDTEKALCESEQFLHTLTDNIPGMVAYWTSDLLCVFANAAHQEQFGKTAEQLRDIHLRDLLGDEIYSYSEPYINAVLQGEFQQFEMPSTKADGTTKTVEVKLVPDGAKGRVQGCFVLATDITILKQTQQRLEQLNTVLEIRTAEADAANRAKSEFLYNMSHEIRNPMNGVIGMTQLLESTDLTEEQQDFVDSLQTSGDSLLALVNDILDLSKIEAGKINFEPAEFDLRRAIEDIYTTQKSILFQKKLKLHIKVDEDFPCVIVGDQLRVKQIIHNLLGNAVKFTEQGGITIAVQVHENYQSHMLAQISVTDSGKGIEPEALDNIFKPFVQEDNSITRQFGGTGLGLSISRRLAELMGGDITVESTQGVGSCFKVNLPFDVPLVSAITGQDAHMHENDWDLAPLKVLLVEDNPINMKFAKILLSKHGHEVVGAENGRECLTTLEAGACDLVLMDIRMPVMSGEDAVRAIRNKELGTSAHQRVIALTANALRGEKERFLNEGFDGYISKPMEQQELIAEMKRVMSL